MISGGGGMNYITLIAMSLPLSGNAIIVEEKL